MKKTLVSLTLAAVAVSAQAKGDTIYPLNPGTRPEQATAGAIFGGVTDELGNMLVCVSRITRPDLKRQARGDCTLGGGSDSTGFFVSMKTAVPAGRTFVDFSIAGFTKYNMTLYVVWWK